MSLQPRCTDIFHCSECNINMYLCSGPKINVLCFFGFFSHTMQYVWYTVCIVCTCMSGLVSKTVLLGKDCEVFTVCTILRMFPISAWPFCFSLVLYAERALKVNSCIMWRIPIYWKCSVTEMFKIVTLQSCGVLTVQLGHRNCCWTTALSSWTAPLCLLGRAGTIVLIIQNRDFRPVYCTCDVLLQSVFSSQLSNSGPCKNLVYVWIVYWNWWNWNATVCSLFYIQT